MRTVSCETSIIRRAMDLGPCGLLLPCVETTDQIDQVQMAAQMPPRGKRRPGGMGNYWLGNYQYETWKSEFEAHFIVIPQIESQARVNNAASLAAHPFVTALGLGHTTFPPIWVVAGNRKTRSTCPRWSGSKRPRTVQTRKCGPAPTLRHFERKVSRFCGLARPLQSSPARSSRAFVTSTPLSRPNNA